MKTGKAVKLDKLSDEMVKELRLYNINQMTVKTLLLILILFLLLLLLLLLLLPPPPPPLLLLLLPKYLEKTELM